MTSEITKTSHAEPVVKMENVEAAKALGFEGVHAVTHEAALEGLASLGVPPYERS